MNYSIICILLVLLAIFCSGFVSVSADVIGRDGACIDDSVDPVSVAFTTEGGTDGEYGVYFFCNSHCGSCHEAIAYFEELAGDGTSLDIGLYDFASDAAYTDLYNSFKEKYHISSLAYPVLFIGDVVLEGYHAIHGNFEELYSENQRLKDEFEESE